MKVFIPFLILMSLLITEAVAQTRPAPTGFTATAVGDRQVTLSWRPPSNIGTDTIEHYYSVYLTGVDRTLTTGSNQELVGGNLGVAVTSTTIRFTINNTYQVSVYGEYTSGSGDLADRIIVTTQIPAPTNFDATLDDPTTGDRTATLRWTAPSPLASGAPAVTYEYSRDDGLTWQPAGSGTTHPVSGLTNGISYRFRARATRSGENADTSSQISRAVTVRPLIDAPGTPGTLNVERVEDTATLTWNPPTEADEQILRYEYSDDGGSNWKSTGSTRTTYTVTGLETGETYTFLVRALYVDGTPSRVISHRSRSSNAVVLSLPKPKRRIIQDCPVGWVRSDGFAGRNRRVLIYEVNLQMEANTFFSGLILHGFRWQGFLTSPMKNTEWL